FWRAGGIHYPPPTPPPKQPPTKRTARCQPSPAASFYLCSSCSWPPRRWQPRSPTATSASACPPPPRPTPSSARTTPVLQSPATIRRARAETKRDGQGRTAAGDRTAACHRERQQGRHAMSQPAPDPNALLGLLAVRSELLSPEAFAETVRPWEREPGEPLGPFLVARGLLQAAELAHLEALVEDCLKRQGHRTQVGDTVPP